MSNNTEVDQQISETVNTANPNTIMNTSPQISSSQTVSNLVTSVEQIIANIKQHIIINKTPYKLDFINKYIYYYSYVLFILS